MIERMLFCAACGACVTTTPQGRLPECACGARYFRPPGLGIWKLSPDDRRMLYQLRISPLDADAEVWR